ncbi:MAG: UDP-N-acetylmuramoyl-L-alanyl-D-glutamate--2,6-diaminopimelate ligase [Clostridia bacterium]|nr:UDP-N-acetylmuramoyl-L-alanyl-D-glutamate--2,6-diaminopimelate ligase [Clostridia bacterium]
MKLRAVLEELQTYTLYGDESCLVKDIQIDSRSCKAQDLFVCVQGFIQDGNRYAIQAIKNGAGSVMTGDLASLCRSVDDAGYTFTEAGICVDDKAIPVIVVPHLRWALARVSATRYDNPSASMQLIGVTGTKGKTTTTCMLRNIFHQAGRMTGMIGTMGSFVGLRSVETDRTTPEANVIQPLLRAMLTEKITTCMMEVSSQGLNLDRVGGCTFSTALFTNLSRDHIGENEHKTMEEYALAKAKLFSLSKRAVLNADSDWYGFMRKEADKNADLDIYTYGIDGAYDFAAKQIQTMPEGVVYDVYEQGTKVCTIEVPIPGRFTVYNSLGAYAVARLEGMTPDQIQKGLKQVFVKGKAEIVPTDRDFTILIDYAHNPDSFENILTTVKEFAKRTVFLFGCGGDRNRPRALMGETAGKFADFTIITSDNPRSEDPESIVRDLEAGIKPTGSPYICIVDRKEAIEYAIRNAQPGDVIILAGKGHETYQIFKDRTVEFDERVIVADILKKIREEEQQV